MTDLIVPDAWEQDPRFTYDERGVVVADGVEYESWAAEFGHIQSFWVRTQRWWPWVLGAMCCYGEDHYGEKYAQAIEVSGLRLQTLKNYASLYRRFGRDGIHAEVSPAHHDAVRALPAEERDRWLDVAWDEGLTVPELRDRLKADQAENGHEIGLPAPTWILRLEMAEIRAVYDLLFGDEGAPVAVPESLETKMVALWARVEEARGA